eukprot:Pgem_evm1s18428
MLADSSDTLSGYYSYPWAFFFALIGYAIIFLIEDVILNKILKRYKTLIEVNSLNGLVHTHGNAHSHQLNNNKETKLSKIQGELVASEANSYNQMSDCCDVEQGTLKSSKVYPIDACNPIDACTNDNKQDLDSSSVDESKEEAFSSIHASLIAFALLFALSFHSFFAGLSIGVTDTTNAIVATLIAVIAHKGVAAFVLGQTFLRSSLSTWTVVLFLVLFATTTPIGIGVGWAIATSTDNIDKTSGFINSISAGTFIYIGCLVVKDAPDRANGNAEYKAGIITRYLLWWLGCGLMAVAAIW